MYSQFQKSCGMCTLKKTLQQSRVVEKPNRQFAFEQSMSGHKFRAELCGGRVAEAIVKPFVLHNRLCDFRTLQHPPGNWFVYYTCTRVYTETRQLWRYFLYVNVCVQPVGKLRS